MEAFRFKNKKSKEIKAIAIASIVGVIFSVLIFSETDFVIEPHILYLLATIVSFVLVMAAIKKAGKEFEEIIIEGDYVKFYFFNKMKDVLKVNKDDILVKVDEEKIEFENKSTGYQIGKSYKNKIEESERWDELVSCFTVQNPL